MKKYIEDLKNIENKINELEQERDNLKDKILDLLYQKSDWGEFLGYNSPVFPGGDWEKYFGDVSTLDVIDDYMMFGYIDSETSFYSRRICITDFIKYIETGKYEK